MLIYKSYSYIHPYTNRNNNVYLFLFFLFNSVNIAIYFSNNGDLIKKINEIIVNDGVGEREWLASNYWNYVDSHFLQIN